MNLGPPQNILIKTYVHDSGLWYLANSLSECLKQDGHQIKFIPKARYIKDDITKKYKKIYLNSALDRQDILPMSVEYSTNNQLLRYVYQYNIKTIISLETLMESSSWISYLKRRTGIKIIDIPMLEWVTPQLFESGIYNQFDEIWGVTDLTYKTFKVKYSQTQKIVWDFVDRKIFFNDQNSFSDPCYTFYHQASLNSAHSTKNTEKVIEAFIKLNKEYPEENKLIITGNLSNSELCSTIYQYPNIKIYNKVLSRQEIANIYSVTDCVISPSSKEGLSLSLFEAEACGCQLITTDAPPMNEHNTKYLCEVANFKKDKTLVAIAELTIDSIYNQMKKAYKENKHE